MVNSIDSLISKMKVGIANNDSVLFVARDLKVLVSALEHHPNGLMHLSHELAEAKKKIAELTPTHEEIRSKVILDLANAGEAPCDIEEYMKGVWDLENPDMSKIEPCPRCGTKSTRYNGEHYCHPSQKGNK